MAQTTDSFSNACGKVWISVGCTGVWTDISGTASQVSGTEQTRTSGEAYTFDGDAAIIGAGKRTPMNVAISIVYSEVAAEAYDLARAAFETACGQNVCVRWSPGAGVSGKDHISTCTGKITSFTYPPMDASAGGPIMAGFTIFTPCVTTVTETT
jgi:hypothetical protein